MSIFKIQQCDQLKSQSDIVASGALICAKVIFLHDMLIAYDTNFRVHQFKKDHIPTSVERFNDNNYDVIPHASCYDWLEFSQEQGIFLTMHEVFPEKYFHHIFFEVLV